MYLLWQTIITESSIRNFLLTIIILGKAKDLKTKGMKKLFVVILAALISLGAYAQDAQQVSADAAKAVNEAPAAKEKTPKPSNWTNSLKTNVTVGQTGLFNWAAGGDNTVSMAAFIDGNANWKKGDMFWNNRLQLDYGFLYASSKPILQKNTDRIYLESKWGYKTEKMKKFYFSANFDFKSQFANGYDYLTPTSLVDENNNKLTGSALVEAWNEARVLKSGFLAPAYTNLALGIDYVPTKWLSINFAPLTGGFVIVRTPELRAAYSMNEKEGITQEMRDAAAGDPIALGNLYNPAKFEFGAQLKADAKVNVNDKFSYTTQLVLFANYLDIKHCPRINWDNRIDWKLAKYFSLTLTTNLIYDDTIMITTEADPTPKARVQFKESLAFGFTYTIASKK